MPVNIGIGVVDDIVSDFPDVPVRAQQIEGEPEHAVYMAIRRVGAMKRVMRYRKADSGHSDPHQKREQPHYTQRKLSRKDQKIAAKIEGEQKHGFENHLKIRMPGEL